jgi:hypothetical protein
LTQFLKNEVVPCWETVRPVPKVTIDFGNGRRLERTLQGNTVLYLCAANGHVVDAYPGVYTPPAFLAEVRKGMEYLRAGGRGLSPESLLAWHREQVSRSITAEQRRITLSKAVVESPLLAALGIGRRPAPAGSPEALNPVADPKRALARVSARIEDVSKQPATVEQLRAQYARTPEGKRPSPEELGKLAVEADTRTNVNLVRPAVHLFLATLGAPPTPQSCRDPLYEQILHVPLNDPYLGLAWALVPGTPGGH